MLNDVHPTIERMPHSLANGAVKPIRDGHTRFRTVLDTAL